MVRLRRHVRGELAALASLKLTLVLFALAIFLVLATHVTCIALGYSTTLLAGFLGLFSVLRGVLTASLTPALSRELGLGWTPRWAWRSYQSAAALDLT